MTPDYDPDTLQFAAHQAHVRVSIGMPADPTAPLVIDDIKDEIVKAATMAAVYAERNKFAHDAKVLRAALYALGSTLTMEEALTDIQNDMHAEKQANALLHGFLAARGWRPYEAVDSTEPQHEKSDGPLSCNQRVKLGQKHGGDVIVCLHSGLTLVAEARDAYLFDWVEVGSGNIYTLRPHDEWWFVKNIKEGIGYDPHGEKYREARQDLVIPTVPADLEQLLTRIPGED